jgi:hypothetical protein
VTVSPAARAIGDGARAVVARTPRRGPTRRGAGTVTARGCRGRREADAYGGGRHPCSENAVGASSVKANDWGSPDGIVTSSTTDAPRLVCVNVQVTTSPRRQDDRRGLDPSLHVPSEVPAGGNRALRRGEGAGAHEAAGLRRRASVKRERLRTGPGRRSARRGTLRVARRDRHLVDEDLAALHVDEGAVDVSPAGRPRRRRRGSRRRTSRSAGPTRAGSVCDDRVGPGADGPSHAGGSRLGARRTSADGRARRRAGSRSSAGRPAADTTGRRGCVPRAVFVNVQSTDSPGLDVDRDVGEGRPSIADRGAAVGARDVRESQPPSAARSR